MRLFGVDLKPEDSRLSGGATEPSQPDLPLWTRSPPNPDSYPGFHPMRTRNPVRIRSKSGQNRVGIRFAVRGSEGVGSRGVGPAGKAL